MKIIVNLLIFCTVTACSSLVTNTDLLVIQEEQEQIILEQYNKEIYKESNQVEQITNNEGY